MNIHLSLVVFMRKLLFIPLAPSMWCLYTLGTINKWHRNETFSVEWHLKKTHKHTHRHITNVLNIHLFRLEKGKKFQLIVVKWHCKLRTFHEIQRRIEIQVVQKAFTFPFRLHFSSTFFFSLVGACNKCRLISWMLVEKPFFNCIKMVFALSMCQHKEKIKMAKLWSESTQIGVMLVTIFADVEICNLQTH